MKAIVVQGMFFGDEGKGATVDFLCRLFPTDLVVRFCGGCQAGHNVVLPDGTHHTFSQWGSGTLAGVPAYLSENVVISPENMVREAEHLKSIGVQDPWSMLTVHPAALVTTPYTIAVNRHKETERGRDRHGSCGLGIGETIQHAEDTEMEIQAFDLHNTSLYPLLRAQEQWARQFVPLDKILHPLKVAEEMKAAAEHLTVDYLPDYNFAIYEGAQGTMLDESSGFFPHVTRGTVTTKHAENMLKDEEVLFLGVMRTYCTRHGAGPLPGHEILEEFEDSYNPHDDWQGSMRAKSYNYGMLQKACRLSRIDEIVLRHEDEYQIPHNYLPRPIAATSCGPTFLDTVIKPNTKLARVAACQAIC